VSVFRLHLGGVNEYILFNLLVFSIWNERLKMKQPVLMLHLFKLISFRKKNNIRREINRASFVPKLVETKKRAP
jgi:hypothetical protein